MLKTLKLLTISVAMAATTQAGAALVGDFQLNGNTTNAAGGALALTNNGATQTATGLTFGQNAGPTITGFTSPSDYSVETRFQFDATGGYRKVLDFFNRASDNGLYVLTNNLNFYPIATGPSVFSPGQYATVVFTRDAGGNAVGYVDGVSQFSFTNAFETTIGTDLNLFRDDFATGGSESGSGAVDYIRIYDTALTAGQVAALGGVPEPAAWALMLGGFGAVGASLRRRRGLIAA